MLGLFGVRRRRANLARQIDCRCVSDTMRSFELQELWRTYLMDVTSQSRATAAWQILLPRKPFPPQTTSFFLAADEADMVL